MNISIKNLQSFPGRNIFCYRPVIMATIDTGSFYDSTTREIEGFNENLLKLLPGLGKHNCALGFEGGFLCRLDEGTYLPHVIEHMTLELQYLMGFDLSYGKARLLKEPSLYYIICEYINERCAVESLRLSVAIVNSLIADGSLNMDEILAELRKITIETEPGPSTRAIIEEARKRKIPVRRVNEGGLLQLGYGKYSRLIAASLTDTAACINVDIAGDKDLTKQILQENGIPVPSGDIAYTEESAVITARDIGYPVVLKPYDGSQGRGVALNLCNENQVREAYREAVKHSKIVLVESHIKGRDYRLLVIGGKVAAAAERMPPYIIGDGIHSIKELVEIENQNPSRGNDHENFLTKIKLDNITINLLAKKGMNAGFIPACNELIFLRENGNLSTGGTARDCTEEVHPYNYCIAVKAAKLLGLDIAGIDITTENIAEPLSCTRGAVIEVNAAPGLRMHLNPTFGRARNVAADIIGLLYPAGQRCDIPIISITGTNGKTTTTRLIKHVLCLTGKKAGMTSTSGIYVGDECILKGDNTGAVSARMVLSNKEVDIAVLETARGGIIRRGLGYDLADVGVVTNVTDDHLGIDGLNSLEDLAFVKALVVESIKPDGYAVLNADDSMTGYMLSRTAGKVLLFSRDSENRILIEHMERGGMAVFVKNHIVMVYNGEKQMKLLNVEDIPITFGGRVECNIENSLAAISALIAVRVPYKIIRSGLCSFMPDILSNPGRFNIFDMGEFKVMLDYCHNIAGYLAVIDFIKKTGAERLVGIIGMPGDRLDKNIMYVGEICGETFSRIYIKEDGDLRGRAPGEVADILFNSAIRGGIGKENIDIIYSETLALNNALENALPGDLIVMCYEEFEPSVKVLEKYKSALAEVRDIEEVLA